MSRPRILTAERIEKLQPRERRYDVPDGDVPNLFVRVGKRLKSFVMSTRFGDAENSTRRAIGSFPAMSLEEARSIARIWNEQLRLKLDPRDVEKRTRENSLLAGRGTFRGAMTDFIAWLPLRERTAHVEKDAHTLRTYVLGSSQTAILDKPVGEVTPLDIETILVAVRDRPAPAVAKNLFSLLGSAYSNDAGR